MVSTSTIVLRHISRLQTIVLCFKPYKLLVSIIKIEKNTSPKALQCLKKWTDLLRFPATRSNIRFLSSGFLFLLGLKTIMDSDSSSSSEEEESPIPEFTSSKEVRNWLEIPPEIMSIIFTKVGAIDILLAVQSVCSTWRNLAKDPHLFRSLAICSCEESITDEERDKMVNVAKEAVNRSCGQLVEFSVHHFPADEILKQITLKQSPLRRLRFSSCLDLSDDVVIDMGKKLPLLEELEICYCLFDYPEEVVENFGRSCLLLKSFRLNYWDQNQKDDLSRIVCDKEALAIGQCMPELHYLNLSGAYLTDNGLWAILDGCPHLNSLDLSECSNLNFAGGLVKMCVDRNIKLRPLDEASISKLITQIWQRIDSQVRLVIPIQKADVLAVYNAADDLEGGNNAIEDLLAGGYAEKVKATSSYTKVLLNELTHIQPMLSVLQENTIQILEVVQKVQAMQAKVQDTMSKIEHFEASIMGSLSDLRSRHSCKT